MSGIALQEPTEGNKKERICLWKMKQVANKVERVVII